MGNRGTVLIYAMSIFVALGLYVSFSVTYGQESEGEQQINAKVCLSIIVPPVMVLTAKEPKGDMN